MDLIAIGEQIEEFLVHEGLTENELQHFGVKGMRWGKTGAGKAGQSPNSFFNKPTAAKAVILGSYGKKSAYTNPAALQIRKNAGKLRIAGLSAAVLGFGVQQIGARTGNQGTVIAGTIIGQVGAAVGVAGLISGAVGATAERKSRLENGI